MDTKKKRVLHFRAGAMEEECLRALCHMEALSLSEALRLAIREAAKARGIWPKTILDRPTEESEQHD